jgi:F-type H+-transporting ATPase subunit b
MKKLIITALALSASPAFAAGGAFFTLRNSNFVVMLAFMLFVAILLWAKAPAKIGALLDGRSTRIKSELEEAKAIREEARKLVASFEAKQKEVAEQSARIVENAKAEAQAAATQARANLKVAIQRRLASAEEQINAAEAAAVRQVREKAVMVAVAAATDILAKGTTPADASASIDAAIVTVDARMH